MFSNVPLTKGVMAGKFELKKAKDGQFMFNLKATNGQVILTSELYKTKASAENGIESVRKNSSREGALKKGPIPEGNHISF